MKRTITSDSIYDQESIREMVTKVCDDLELEEDVVRRNAKIGKAKNSVIKPDKLVSLCENLDLELRLDFSANEVSITYPLQNETSHEKSYEEPDNFVAPPIEGEDSEDEEEDFPF